MRRLQWFRHKVSKLQETGQEARYPFLPSAFRKNVALPTPWSWTSGLQNSETKNFRCWSQSVGGTLLWPPLKASTGVFLSDRGWNCWMASPTQWTWVWANSSEEWRGSARQGSLACCSPRGRKELGLSDWRTSAFHSYPLEPSVLKVLYWVILKISYEGTRFV